jgi:hypothetical protein
MAGQMSNMMTTVGQNVQQPFMTPPPPPMSAYHVAINGQNAGPFNMTQLQQMVASGQLMNTTHVWKQGMADWDLAGNIQELGSLFMVPPPPPPPTSSTAQES